METIQEATGTSHGGFNYITDNNNGGGNCAAGNGQTTVKLSCPHFLFKLYKLVNDKATDSIISWGPSSNTFIISDEQLLISDILPSQFKIDTFDNFTYQLNNYDFKTKKEGGHLEFEHEYFQAGNQHLLKHIIKRQNQSLMATNAPTLGVTMNELEALFAKLIHAQNQIKYKIHRFKDDLGKSLLEVKNIIEESSQKVSSTFSQGRKRKLFDFNLGNDYVGIEKDFKLMYEQIEVSPTHVDGFTTLSDLTDKMLDEYNLKDRGSGFGDVHRVPQFVQKLYDMVEREDINSFVSWNFPHRDSFIIRDTNKFATQVLPMYFTHSNFSSFNTQLNIYGFKKISWERHEYANEWFQGGRYDWLVNIKRRNKNPLLTRSVIKLSITEVEMFKGQLRTIEQEQENKIVYISNYEREMKSSVQELKETVINMANIVNKMILTSKENLETCKKPNLGFEDKVIDNIEGQDMDVDELGGNNMAIIDNNTEAQDYFLDFNNVIDAMRKNIEREDSWIAEREMEQYLTFCTGREDEIEQKAKC